MTSQTTNGFVRLYRATLFSIKGLAAAFRHEQAFRLELYLAVILLPLGLWLGTNGTERAMLAGSLLLVLIVELINSAIEAVVDRFGGELHELSGRAKDVGSAAVLVALLNVLVIWYLILFS